jgi:ankyrin repeat protein
LTIGETPLHYASQNGYLEIVNALLAAGANVNTQDKYDIRIYIQF